MKILINNEEVVCKNNLIIKEKMLSTSSTILNNCYPKAWENDKDYTTRFYYPKDYSKCKIVEETYHPYIPGTTEKNTMFNFDYDTTKQWQLNGLFGNTIQNGTPTPSSPVPIQSVTGLQNVSITGKNMLDYSTLQYGYVGSNGTIVNTHTAGEMYSNFIKVSPSTTYTFKIFETSTTYNNWFVVGEYSTNDQSSFIIRDTMTTATQDYITFTTSATTQYVRVSARNLENATKVQLEKGSTATTYEPYKGNTYEVNLGKNLFDGNYVNAYIGGNSGYQFNYANNTRTAIVKVQPKTTYTIKKYNGTGIGTRFVISEYPILLNSSTEMGENSRLFSDSNVSQATVTTSSTGNYLYIYVTNSIDDIPYLQIEKGSNATPYSPYFTPIELNKIGDYEDRIYKENGTWYIEKNIGKVVLNGSENIVQGTQEFTNVIRYSLYRPKGIIFKNIINSSSGYNNQFPIINNFNLDSEHLYLYNEVVYMFYNKTNIANVTALKTFLSNNNLIIYGILATPITEEITDEDLINQLESIYLMTLKEGTNNISVTSSNLPIILEIHYNYKDAWTEEDIIFCGCVKNTGKISLNPREPHYCDLQVLDFKTLLSEGETLNYVITNKTITEAIKQVVGSISDYGFVVGNIEVSNPNDVINAYSTLNKTAYDVFQYIADITQSRWFTRLVDENTIAIDFYDPSLMTQADPIEYTQEYFEENEIVDMSFNYSTNDYRNKQIMTSDEVYGNIELTETKIADGYAKTYMCDNKIGNITKITVNGVEKTVITKAESNLGIIGDFIYQPGEMIFNSSQIQSTGAIIDVFYYPIVKGREIILDAVESDRIGTQIDRKGTISRYENRNDTTTSQELQKIGQSYLKFKGKPQITLKIQSTMNLFNIGDVVNFEAPINELSVDYMVKNKTTNMYITGEKTFYTFELVNNFNSEDEINYFDNQRAKSQGNIGEGEYITHNIDLESTALIKFYDTDINQEQIGTLTKLDFQLESVL